MFVMRHNQNIKRKHWKSKNKKYTHCHLYENCFSCHALKTSTHTSHKTFFNAGDFTEGDSARDFISQKDKPFQVKGRTLLVSLVLWSHSPSPRSQASSLASSSPPTPHPSHLWPSCFSCQAIQLSPVPSSKLRGPFLHRRRWFTTTSRTKRAGELI